MLRIPLYIVSARAGISSQRASGVVNEYFNSPALLSRLFRALDELEDEKQRDGGAA